MADAVDADWSMRDDGSVRAFAVNGPVLYLRTPRRLFKGSMSLLQLYGKVV